MSLKHRLKIYHCLHLCVHLSLIYILKGVETFKGYSKQINKYPLRIDFSWPSLTAKYNKTYVFNTLNDENLDLYIVCDIETTIFETKSKYGQFTLNTKFIRSDISLLDITERHYKMDKELEYSKEQLK